MIEIQKHQVSLEITELSYLIFRFGQSNPKVFSAYTQKDDDYFARVDDVLFIRIISLKNKIAGSLSIASLSIAYDVGRVFVFQVVSI